MEMYNVGIEVESKSDWIEVWRSFGKCAVVAKMPLEREIIGHATHNGKNALARAQFREFCEDYIL